MSSGTDASDARPRPSGSDELGQWLEALLDGALEAGALTLPAVVVVAAVTADLRAVAAVLGAVVAIAGTAAAQRRGLSTPGPTWPPLSVRSGALRAVWYSAAGLAALLAVLRSGPSPPSPSTLAAAIVVGLCFGAAGALSFPFAAAGVDAVRRRVR